MKIEVCINRIEDVLSVQSYNVDRIELCIELGCGGLTPSIALVEQALAISRIPIHVLVRPRSGNFFYTKETIMLMKRTLEQLREFPIAGVVTGALLADKDLPLDTLKMFRSVYSSAELYFHRAFDEVNDPKKALSNLIDLGYDGVLTSGQKETALEGIDSLCQWKHFANREITILPGSGINADNCLVFNDMGFDWIHLSAKRKLEAAYDSLFSNQQYQLDLAGLKQVINLIKS